MANKTSLGLKTTLRSASNKEERAAILDGLPYTEGFAKPPVRTQFKPGNTYGRRGRPKGSQNLSTILTEEFNQKIEVNEKGKKSKVTKQRVAIRQLANSAATGDLKATALYIEALRKTGGLAKDEQTSGPIFDSHDAEAFDRMVAFIANAGPSEDSE
jgi:hypothetical protein